MSSEEELIKRAQAGEAEAFCTLAQTHERHVYALAYHYCRGRQDAEDLSQEVWLKAFAALRTFRFESSFYTWLRKITINCFLNYRRKVLPFQQKLTSDLLLDEATVSERNARVSKLETSLQDQLTVDKVMQALSDVTAQQRLIFLLKHLEGMTYEEIASELGCSLGTVKKSISRTIKKLREKLGVNEQPEDYASCAATSLLK